MLCNMLSVFSAESITEASNGEEAIQLITDNHYDVILCDYNLGNGKDGQQVLEEAKEKELIPYSTIYIMTTAENTSEMVMGAVEYMPDDYLSKPFTKEVLISRLKKLVDRKENLRKISLSIQQRDYVSAIEMCSKLLDKKPKNRYELLKIQTDLYIRIKDYQHAEENIRIVLNEREIPWALLYLGQVHFYREEYDEAKYIFEDLSEDNPNYLFAHDWLAKVHEKKGDYVLSQESLSKAVTRSPKSIKRQKILADISFKNKDFDTSESAYRKIVRTGKHSCYLSPDDFSGLARVYIQKGMSVDAVSTINSMKDLFCQPGTDDNIKTKVNEVLIYDEMLNKEKTVSSIQAVMSEFERSPGSLHSADAVTIATLCYKNAQDEDANKLIRHAIRNNHDNQSAIDEIISTLTDMNVSQDFIKSLMKTREEVVELNNRGVKLATTGKIEDSISLFLKASSAMSENTVINLNTAQSLIMHMKMSGATDDLIRVTKKHLDRVTFDGKPSEKYRMLTTAYRELKDTIENVNDRVFP